MDLKRTIYKRLLDWKNDSQHSTLQISGARQVGKTYLINKFADENFAKKIYINLFELSGKQFLECYEQAIAWKPGTRRSEHPLHDAFKLYDIEFQDTDDTVIIIDEIQESAEIYNRIWEFTRYFKAHFIVIASYLGRIYDSEFRFSSGDVTKLTIYIMSFEEFIMAYDSQIYTKYCNMDQPQEEDIYDQYMVL